jgi:hypothetical protein
MQLIAYKKYLSSHVSFSRENDWMLPSNQDSLKRVKCHSWPNIYLFQCSCFLLDSHVYLAAEEVAIKDPKLKSLHLSSGPKYLRLYQHVYCCLSYTFLGSSAKLITQSHGDSNSKFYRMNDTLLRCVLATIYRQLCSEENYSNRFVSTISTIPH